MGEASPTGGDGRSGATIVPCLRYRDAPAAIEWLCEAFGFEKQLVVEGGPGQIIHSQLRLGTGMVMVGSVREEEHGLGVPAELGGITQSNYVIVADPDALCARARAAGAEILTDVADVEDRGRLFTCRDPGGHVWHFGNYDPFPIAVLD